MKVAIKDLKKEFDKKIKGVSSTQEITSLKEFFLGKRGPISDLMKQLRDVPPQEKPQWGQAINVLKQDIAFAIEEKYALLKEHEISLQLEKESLDVSLPGKKDWMGRKHPISQMIEKTVHVLEKMGFSVFLTNEMESEYYNYGGLNYPEDHPARDMQDTYYIDENTLLRSHTTTFQQRIMESYKPPLRFCSIGKCYRNETISSRSHVLFHQVDVMYIAKGVTMADLLTTLESFYSLLFEKEAKLRIRSSYFPFVEPGIEVDVNCMLCDGKGCRICKETGWLEMCGAGMIHPEVLKQGGIDPDEYSGFAWGGGIERTYLMMHGVKDIRLFLENDMRFLEQFS